jgi:filamentous hemagglutinin family protein
MMQKSLCGKMPQLRALVLAVQAAWGLSAWSLPQGATVVNGQVTVSQPSAGAMQIKASNGAIINWKQFSIAGGESTQFLQPSASSAVLNRVTGADPSQLLGQLKANGQVFLINPNGLVIGSGARIDTSSFIGSTLDIADADFLTGRLRFLGGAGAGRIRNEGLITVVPGGRIALIAPDIENTGIIQAPDGSILLAAGRKLEIASLDLDGVTFEIQAPTDSVLNLGKLLAENGAVRAFAGTLRHSGEIRASRLIQDSDGSIVLAGSNEVTLTADSVTNAGGLAGGSILVQSANGTTRVSGEVSADGAAGSGGDIRLLGQRVALESGARVDASGSAGGGQILVGGDFQGKNAGVQNAERVYVAAGAQLNADAIVQGDGGRVIVWADENTRYHGSLSARGGADGGNGGLAEVSGKTNLEFAGAANLSAPAGLSGSLLLDPLDIIISTTSGILPTVVDEFADFSSNVVTVSPAALAAVAANITLQAERDIYVKDAVALTASGAGFTATAGGALFDAGTIYNNAGISTTAGAVTLRAEGISGAGGITTAGGDVDLLTSGALNYGGAISSGGGTVTLASQAAYVNEANVNAGSGVINVTGQTGVFGGSHTTTGTANLTATSGSISGSDVSAGVANLTASSSINANVDVTDRVNANSSGSYAQIYGNGTGPLRLGTLTGNSGLYLHSSTGMEQASGGMLTSTFVNLYTDGASAAAGTLAAPLLIASPSALVQPSVSVFDMAAPVHLGFSGSPTLGGLSLEGTVAALGASTVNAASSANLTSVSFGAGTGVLNVSAVSTGGLASGFQLNVSDGVINAATLTLPGAPVELTANGAVTVGTMSGDSLSISAKGAVAITSATTTGSSGINVNTGICDYYAYVGCTASSPITAGTLNAGITGNVNLSTDDNGDISVTGSLTARSANLQAGTTYYTAYPNYPYYSQSTNNNINIASATTANSFTARNYGIGDITVGSLASAGEVNVSAGSSYRISSLVNPFYTDVRTVNNISITNAEPAAATDYFQISNTGVGNVTVTGSINRPSGGIYLSAQNGSVTAASNHSASSSIYVSAGTGSVALGNLTSSTEEVSVDAATTLTVGQVASGSGTTYGNVNLNAGGNLVFNTIVSSGYYSGYGNVNLSSSSGSIKTTANNTALDVTASSNVTMTANDATNGFIGNGLFANPMDIQAGANSAVTLSAGKDIGAAGKSVKVDTNGTLDITSSGGQFHVAATASSVEKSLSTIRLSASAAGIGSGNTSTFASADLDLTAASDGSVITFGDLVRSAGTLNEFKFAATGTSGLMFGNVDLSTTGFNQLLLSGTNGLMQATGNVNAGYMNLAGGAGAVLLGNVTASSVTGNSVNISGTDILAGDITAPSLTVTGANLALGSLTTTGTHRGYYTGYDFIPRLGFSDYVLDELKLTASGNVMTSGNLISPTSVLVNAGGSITVAGGAGLVTAGTTTICCTYYTDTAKLWAGASAGNTLAAADISAYDVNLKADTVQVANLTAVGSLNVSGTDLSTGTVNASNATLAAVNQLTTGTVTGSQINLSGNAFNTGDVSAAGGLTITSTAGYAPNGVALSANSATIDATGDISLLSSNSTSLTAPNVNLRSSGGNVSAELTSTGNLTIDTAAGFNVSSDTWLGNLNVSASWDAALAAGPNFALVESLVDGPSQTFTYGNSGGTGPFMFSIESSIGSTSPWNATYRDRSVTPVVGGASIDIAHAAGGNFNIGFDSDTVLGDLNASLGTSASGSSTGANLVVATGGGVHLSSVTTNGGSINATSRNADITFGTLSTSAEGFAGNVTLTADNGNIAVDAATTHLISTASFCTVCTFFSQVSYGSVALDAPKGSVGASGVSGAIPLSYASSLSVDAKNTINVSQGAGVLSSLDLSTSGGGSGTLTVSDANFSGLSLVRNAGNIELSGLNPVQLANFGLTTVDGSIVVKSDIANVDALTLNAAYGVSSTADLVIQASGGARSVSAGSYNLRAGHDVLITAGTAAGDNVAVAATGSSGHSYVYAGHDIKVTGDGGAASVTHAATGWTQYLNAGNDLRVTGGSTGLAGSSAAITTAGHQNENVGNDLVIQAGSADAAFAKIEAAQSQYTSGVNNLSVLGGGNSASASLQGASQDFTNVRGSVTASGGTGTNALARIESMTAGQTFGYYYNRVGKVLVQGGSGSGASAAIRAAGSQTVNSDGDVQVLGGSASGSDAEILSASGSQTIGLTDTYWGVATQNILVQAGAGGAARIKASGTQSVQGGGNISVLGGTGTGMSASIETTAGSQTIGSSYTYLNDATANILIQGGTGSTAAASVKATGFQSINAGGTVSVLGNTGGGADAEIVSSGSGQQIGSTSTSSNDETDFILVQAGSGGVARILALGSQTLMTSGDLSVIGGGAANMTASIESTGGSQNMGSTYMFSNDPTGNVLVQAGAFSGAAAWIKASTGQTIDAGGTIALVGGAAGAFAELSTSTGSQNIGNVNCCSYDQTDSISLTGGTAAGSYARMSTGENQDVRTSANLSLTGGVGSDSGAQLMAGTGQSITAFGNLSMAGGNGTGTGLLATAIRNSASGDQRLTVTGDITVTGGSGLSDTWIYQVGNGLQSIDAGGNLKLSSDASNVNVTSIESLGTGGQAIDVGGAITVDNKAGWHVKITSSGTQTISADSLAISLASTNGTNPYAGVAATGNQSVTLNGVDANLDNVNDAGSATLSVVNLSNAGGSLAELKSGASQTILMNYDAAGQVVIGNVAGQGVAKITAGAGHTLVAGSLLIQGGSGVGSDASLQAPAGTMVLSTLYGPVELKGGVNGAALIDPPQLDVASNGSVSLLAGTNATADATITAGLFNLAATTGDLNLINSSLATASIAATTFNFTGPGAVNLSGGTITATSGGAINVLGLCNNCSTNLVGPFSVTAFVPPPTNFGAAVAGDILILSDLASGLFDAYIDETGNLVLTRRRLNQCY